MDKEQIIHLLRKYQQQTATSEEKSVFAAILQDKRYEALFNEIFDQYWEDLTLAEINQVQIPNAAQILQEIKKEPQIVVRRSRLWPKLAIAAAILLVAFGASFFFYTSEPVTRHLEIAHDIAPGKIGATLTLANGKKIRLSDVANGEIIKESGISISKTTDGQLVYQIKAVKGNPNQTNTLTTARGETYMVMLPDQSKVWLNAASSLTYGIALPSVGARKLKLSGEAYFEVAKDKIHPFIVESGKQQVEVLGTHFNVNAYPEEKIYRTTLLEGSVKVADGAQMSMLVPGNQAANADGNIKISNVDTDLAVAWKNNNFIFDRLDIKDIMRMIERWYDVEVIYTEEFPSRTFWGSVSRFDNISKVLISLELTGNVHFEVKGRKIYVSR